MVGPVKSFFVSNRFRDCPVSRRLLRCAAAFCKQSGSHLSQQEGYFLIITVIMQMYFFFSFTGGVVQSKGKEGRMPQTCWRHAFKKNLKIGAQEQDLRIRKERKKDRIGHCDLGGCSISKSTSNKLEHEDIQGW